MCLLATLTDSSLKSNYETIKIIMNTTKNQCNDQQAWFLISGSIISGILGVGFNTLMIVAIIKSERSNFNKIRRTFKYIIHQCIADAIFGLNIVLSIVTCTKRITDYVPTFCDINHVLRIASFCSSAMIMVVIAVDRLRAVRYPRWKCLPYKAAIMSAWTIGSISGLIFVIQLQSPVYFGECPIDFRRSLRISDADFFVNNVNTRFIPIFTFVTSFSVVVPCYALIIFTLMRAPKVSRNNRNVSNERNNRVIILVISLATAYFCAMSPIVVHKMYQGSYGNRGKKGISSAYAWYSFLFFATSWINPIIFIVTNQSTGQKIMSMFRKVCFLKNTKNSKTFPIPSKDSSNTQEQFSMS